MQAEQPGLEAGAPRWDAGVPGAVAGVGLVSSCPHLILVSRSQTAKKLTWYKCPLTVSGYILLQGDFFSLKRTCKENKLTVLRQGMPQQRLHSPCRASSRNERKTSKRVKRQDSVLISHK